MPAIGLYDPPFESKAPAPPAGRFEAAILHGIANPLHLTAGGVLYDDAEILSDQLKKLNDQLAARFASASTTPSPGPSRCINGSILLCRECGPPPWSAWPALLPVPLGLLGP
jgi:hypothetical protein